MPQLKTSGERLFDWIMARYLPRRSNGDSWIGSIATDFRMEKRELEDLLVESASLMLLRRLIRNANWYFDAYRGLREDEILAKYASEFLADTLAIGRADRSILLKLVYAAALASNEVIAPGLERRLKAAAKARDQYCEIGGCTIDYVSLGNATSFSLDHIWPRVLGGESEEWNLRVTCTSCNSQRSNYVSHADIHYEHRFAASNSVIQDPGQLPREVSNDLLHAALLRAGFQCEWCGMPVDKMKGKAAFRRRNRGENFSLFNIQVLCPEHSSLVQI